MEMKEIWGLTCGIMAGIFLLGGILFAALGEKGAMLISGFNTLPMEEREHYDRKRMAADMRNIMLVWCAVLAVGAVLSVAAGSIFGAAAVAVWLVLFFRNVHLDAEKAFKKYRND